MCSVNVLAWNQGWITDSKQQERVWGQRGEEESKIGEGLVIAVSIASPTEICRVSRIRNWEMREVRGPSYSKSTTPLG